MKLTVLVDNNTLIDRYFIGEPGLSFLIEDGDKKVLFDTGYSDAMMKNADLMKISLTGLDNIVFSHGHLDHTWGLHYLIKRLTDISFEGVQTGKPVLIAHPLTFNSKIVENVGEIGALIGKEKLAAFFDLKLEKNAIPLTERLFFLGEIERRNDFEAQEPMGKVVIDGVGQDDYLLDDTALVYKSPDGLIIITGCSHAGICNIITRAREVCGEERIADIIGGFHLLEPRRRQLQGTVNFMKGLGLKEMHPCHCTDLTSKIALSEVAPVKEVGVGMSLEYK